MALAFARSAGYVRIFLLTESVLKRAAGVYKAAGFTLSWERDEVNWGNGFVQQRYDKVL